MKGIDFRNSLTLAKIFVLVTLVIKTRQKYFENYHHENLKELFFRFEFLQWS